MSAVKEKVNLEIVERERFQLMLNLAKGFVAKDTTAASNIKLQYLNTMKGTAGHSLMLIATDGTHTLIQGHMSDKGIINGSHPFDILVPPDFAELVAKIPKKNKVNIELEDNQLTFKTGKNKYEMVISSTDDFPSINYEQGTAFTIDSKQFSESLKQAIAYIDPRQIGPLSGIHLRGKDSQLIVEVTDRTCLYFEELAAHIPEEIDLIISRDTASKILQLFEKEVSTPLRVELVGLTLKISAINRTLIARTLDGNYPKLSAIDNSFNEQGHVTVDSSEFLDAIARLLVYAKSADKQIHTVIVEINENSKEMVFRVANELGKTVEVMDCPDMTGSVRFGLNIQLFREHLKGFPAEQVKLSFEAPLKPIKICPIGNERLHYAYVQTVRLH